MDPNNPDPNNPNPPPPSTPDLSSVLGAQPTNTATSSLDPSPPPAPTNDPTFPPPPPLTPDPLTPAAAPTATDQLNQAPAWAAPPPVNEPPPPPMEPLAPSTSTDPLTSQPADTPTWPPAPDSTTPPSWDNPLNTPATPPSIDGGLNPPPATTEPAAEQPVQNAAPSWQPENTDYTPPQPLDTAPTDLSHLVDNSPQQEIPSNYTTPVTQPETLVVPPNGGETVTPMVPIEGGHSGMPKWVIGVGAALLLAVVGASAYFILGIGRPVETTSLPAVEESSQLSVPPTPLPTPIATPPIATSSGFGTLGASPTPIATSAADLIKQRQQQQSQ